METVNYELSGVLPPSAIGVRFLRLEMAASEYLPLAIVWYSASNDLSVQQGARIDLQKQVFLDDLVQFDRSSFSAEARLIVAFANSVSSAVEPAMIMARSAR